MNTVKKEGGYKLTFSSLKSDFRLYLVLVLVSWGLVPLCAKTVNLPGGVTTMIVNWTALLTVFVIMVVFGYTWQFAKLNRYFLPFTLLSIVWPLIYSIAYFNVVKHGSGSLATLLNYTWPLFAAYLLFRRKREVVSKLAIASMVISVIILAAVLIYEGNLVLGLLPIVLGVIAAFTQGYFNVEGENNERYPADLTWLLTFVGALVTAVGATFFTVLTEDVNLGGLTLEGIWPLLVIGAVGNGVGFWAFLKAIKMCGTVEEKIGFWKGMMFVPVVQVVLIILPGIGVEQIGFPRAIALVAIAVNFYLFKRWQVIHSRS